MSAIDEFLRWAAKNQNVNFFRPTRVLCKRGHNSRRDKRLKWQSKHPGRIRRRHGR